MRRGDPKQFIMTHHYNKEGIISLKNEEPSRNL